MKIVFFAHPIFLGHQSMPRYAKMLVDGMKERGHKADLWMPQAAFFNLPFPTALKKWMGYIDQYIIFPRQVKRKLRSSPDDTLFVFTDHALGPWIPLVADKLHVIHCHDFLAQQSALGEIPENPVGLTGRLYQAYIRKGYSKGKNFISVSQNSRRDLERFLPIPPRLSEVVYNGFNQDFVPIDSCKAKTILCEMTGLDLAKGFLLHVGGNQWYKNRIGVIELYETWRSSYKSDLPLLLIGEKPDEKLLKIKEDSHFKENIYFLPDRTDQFVRLAYAAASVFIYPSIAEGFGWPIAEAMASGCPVVTTNHAPMTEVADNAGFLIPRRPLDREEVKLWATDSAKIINDILLLSPNERKAVTRLGFQNIERFDRNFALKQIEAIYEKVLNEDIEV